MLILVRLTIEWKLIYLQLMTQMTAECVHLKQKVYIFRWKHTVYYSTN